ncbi:hypothetical protein RB195_023520 [Necator americanus]|uniref:CBS domain protein n=1 Tax=Necator americanus TaxID=51031 RepID=A0ABR1EJJ3_NECAM
MSSFIIVSAQERLHRIERNESMPPPNTELECEHWTVEECMDPESRQHRQRFLVSPGQVIPQQSKTRRNSPTRRNAFCSLEINEYTMQGYMQQARKCLHYMQFGHPKQQRKPVFMYDLSQDEQKEWEAARLNEEVDLTDDIDPAPFQIVRKTSLLSIHSIFSMLQLSKVYVTGRGRLIGVVSLNDVSYVYSNEKLYACEDDLGGFVQDAQQSHRMSVPKVLSLTLLMDKNGLRGLPLV